MVGAPWSRHRCSRARREFPSSGVDTHVKTESKKEGRIKTGTKRALVRGDVRVPAAITCFRHLTGRSAQAVEEQTRELHPLELPNPAPFPPQNPVGFPPSKLENCAPSRYLKSCSVRNRSIRRKWLILVGFAGFLSDLAGQKKFHSRPRDAGPAFHVQRHRRLHQSQQRT